MCKFFSIISDGNGKPYYFDSKIRKEIIDGKLKYETDSHSSIADYFGFKGEKEDVLNKYEFNPLTKVFKIDQLNTANDSEIINDFCMSLDFKTIVPELNIKKIIHPFEDIKTKKVTKKDIELLKKWDSVGDSVWDSVWDSVGAYFSSFFKIKYRYSFKSCIKLWEKGFVPSFDGKTWRLHTGEKAKIVFKITEKKLKKGK